MSENRQRQKADPPSGDDKQEKQMTKQEKQKQMIVRSDGVCQG
jgi:hypothetical protein